MIVHNSTEQAGFQMDSLAHVCKTVLLERTKKKHDGSKIRWERALDIS